MLNEEQRHAVADAYQRRMEVASADPDMCPHTLFTEVTDDEVCVELVQIGMQSLEQAAILNSMGAMDGETLAGVAEHTLISALAFGIAYGKADATVDMADAADTLESLTGPDGIAWS